MHYLLWLVAASLFAAVFAGYGDVTTGAFAIAAIGWGLAGAFSREVDKLSDMVLKRQ